MNGLNACEDARRRGIAPGAFPGFSRALAQASRNALGSAPTMDRFAPSFVLVCCAMLLLTACTGFPAPRPGGSFEDGLSAAQVFELCMEAHGGDLRDHPGDINISTDGRWHSLILRIQPVVTDAGFRISSEERLRPRDGIYAVQHRGPEGVKQVLRTPAGLRVHYNGVPEPAGDRLRATAMTNDAFHLFHFGPSFVKHRATSMTRLRDAREGGRVYRRVHARLEPGFGESAADDVVLWIDAGTSRLFRVHMTLEGFETTRGAHVDTTFLDYVQAGPYLLPSRFSERVRGPLRIMAHEWHVTGIDLDRGWSDADVGGAAFTGRAAAAASPLPRPARAARVDR
jgi:hypothetical protein